MDQGAEDNFLHQKQLLPEELVTSASKNDKVNLKYRLQDGYDHSYYFIASFMKDHIEFHAKHFWRIVKDILILKLISIRLL